MSNKTEQHKNKVGKINLTDGRVLTITPNPTEAACEIILKANNGNRASEPFQKARQAFLRSQKWEAGVVQGIGSSLATAYFKQSQAWLKDCMSFFQERSKETLEIESLSIDVYESEKLGGELWKTVTMPYETYLSKVQLATSINVDTHKEATRVITDSSVEADLDFFADMLNAEPVSKPASKPAASKPS